MAAGVGLLWDLVARDNASPAFLRVAGAADKAATATGRAQAKVAAAGAKMSSVGAMMSRRLTLPLLAIGAASVKAATDFNASMTRIQTQAGASARDVQILTKHVLAMKGAQQGPNDLAGALYHLKSVGLDNAAAMKALRASSDLAAVGNADLEETTNALAGAWRSGIKGAGSFAHTAATVNAIIGAGNMTLGDFTEGLSTGILPAARTFGVSLQSIGAALSVFTDEGVPANVALTRMRMSLSLLGAPTDKAAKLLDGIGISSTQLAKDMRAGPNGLLNAVTDLKDHLSGLSKVAQAQFLSHAFGGGRSSSAIMTMINQTGLLGKKWDQVTGSISKYGDAVKTQQATPQAQFKVAVANLEKAGVLLGNQLLPIATDLAHVITSIASGFNGLSGGTKHFITELGIGLLVLGPMLSLVGKVTKGVLVMRAAMGAMSGGAGTAAKAIGGAGLGFAIGYMARESSTGTKALSVLGATAAGLAIGGPVGALAGLLGSLAGAFGTSGGAVSQAAKDMSANIDYLTAALVKNGGAINADIRAWTASKLVQDGVLEQAGKLGLSYDTLTRAALGNKSAMAQVTAAGKSMDISLGGNGTMAALAADDVLKLGKAYNLSAEAAKKDIAVKRASFVAHARVTDAVSHLAGGLQNEAVASDGAAGASKSASSAMAGEHSAATLLSQSLAKLTKDYLKATNAALGIAQSEAGFLDSLHSMSQALKDSNGSLSLHSAKARAAREQLYGAAQGALAMDDGTRKGNAALLDQIKTLRAHAISAGADAGAIDKILGRLHLLPRQINMKLNVDTGASMSKLRELQTQINNMHGKTLFVGVAGGRVLGDNGTPRAMGGAIRGRGTETSDSIHIAASNNEHMWSAREVRGAGGHGAVARLRAAARSGYLRGFKDGGPITKTTSGGKTVWVYKGQQYPTLKAAQNAEGYKLTGAPGVGGTKYSSRKAADNALAKAIKSLDKIFNHMSRHDLPNLRKALGKTGSDVRSAVSAFLQDAKQVGVSLATRRSIAAEGRDLASNVNARNRAQARLSTLLQNRAALKHSVAAAGRGGFDITSAGTNATNDHVSFGAFKAQETQYANIVHKWASGIRKLSKLGFGDSPTGRAMLAQFAQADPTVALPRIMALLSASPHQLAGIIATEKDIGKVSSKLGGFLGQQKYGDKISHQRDEIQLANRIIRQEFDHLRKELRALADRKIEVDVTLDGRKVGSGVAKGNRRNGRRN